MIFIAYEQRSWSASDPDVVVPHFLSLSDGRVIDFVHHLAFWWSIRFRFSFGKTKVMIHVFCSQKSHKPLIVYELLQILCSMNHFSNCNKNETNGTFTSAAMPKSFMIAYQMANILPNVCRTFERHCVHTAIRSKDSYVRCFSFVVVVACTDGCICSNNPWTRSVTLYRFFFHWFCCCCWCCSCLEPFDVSISLIYISKCLNIRANNLSVCCGIPPI